MRNQPGSEARFEAGLCPSGKPAVFLVPEDEPFQKWVCSHRTLRAARLHVWLLNLLGG